MERVNIFFCCFKTYVSKKNLVNYDYLEICTYSVCVCAELHIVVDGLSLFDACLQGITD